MTFFCRQCLSSEATLTTKRNPPKAPPHTQQGPLLDGKTWMIGLGLASSPAATVPSNWGKDSPLSSPPSAQEKDIPHPQCLPSSAVDGHWRVVAGEADREGGGPLEHLKL